MKFRHRIFQTHSIFQKNENHSLFETRASADPLLLFEKYCKLNMLTMQGNGS